jgi:hypothetical protein
VGATSLAFTVPLVVVLAAVTATDLERRIVPDRWSLPPRRGR